MSIMFYGSIPALITPFKDGEIDMKSFADFVEWQVENGSHGVVPCGTTGESPVLDDEEYRSIFTMTMSVVKGRIPVIAGTGSNSTRKAIQLTQIAEECGVDAVLVVVPYYNRPTQEGLYAHFKTIHDATKLPIIVYNVPSRCGTEIAVETIIKLAELPRIVGLKDATSDTSRVIQIKAAVKENFCVLSGEDALAGAFLAQGADGCISVTANIAPRECADFQNAWRNKDFETFNRIQTQLMPLHKALFVESSPAPVKYAASVLGMCSGDVRLPLVSASLKAQQIVEQAMGQSGLLNLEKTVKYRAHG
jgi:4-hydroxy-tetrahydrodipicolinate synthase